LEQARDGVAEAWCQVRHLDKQLDSALESERETKKKLTELQRKLNETQAALVTSSQAFADLVSGFQVLGENSRIRDNGLKLELAGPHKAFLTHDRILDGLRSDTTALRTGMADQSQEAEKTSKRILSELGSDLARLGSANSFRSFAGSFQSASSTGAGRSSVGNVVGSWRQCGERSGQLYDTACVVPLS
jgi:hypothetical protein